MKTKKAEPRKAKTPQDSALVKLSGRENQKRKSFPIVGIGASAGGLEAFLQFLRNLPPKTGMAFVYVQHLAPDHPSSLPEVLGKATMLPVIQVEDGVSVEPNHIYIIPPNCTMSIRNYRLYLVPREVTRMPIDFFFESMAKDLGKRAIGVILSGTASDGTFGVKAIKEAEGLTFAQSLKTAKYDGMPRNAIMSGHVDVILPPNEMAAEIANIVSHPYLAEKYKEEPALPKKETLEKIFKLLLSKTGVDFAYYKPTTIMRRISRRMLFSKVSDLDSYYAILKSNAKEMTFLYDDMLINVTNFFRDPQMFETLKKEILPTLIRRDSSDPIRIWVPGCSTGEETYSLAITILEYIQSKSMTPQIQIFGTDISENMITKARGGVYPLTIAQDVSPERLKRFFVETDHSYQIAKYVRDMCIFARHNVVKDPPFSKLDIVSCRNLLIYFGPVLQKRVIPVFNYALKPNGYLILGSTESIGGFVDYFVPADRKFKIYKKKTMPRRMEFDFEARPAPKPAGIEPPPDDTVLTRDILKEGDRLLLNKYVPAAVIVDSNFEILQFRGNTSLFLQPGQGQASLNLLKMAREGLMMTLRTVVQSARRTNAMVRQEDLKLKSDHQMVHFSIEVIPFLAGHMDENFFLVLFDVQETEARSKPKRIPKKKVQQDQNLEMQQLRGELAATREYLESIIEEQEAANEELRAANEEILSSSEEMQSTHEEMEIAKEELQSANEELTTLNEEAANKNMELSLLNNDLTNILSCVQFAILMLEPDLRIRRFTPSAEKILNLIPSDVGRPMTDINMTIPVTTLEKWILSVIRNLQMEEHKIQDRSGRWFKVQIRPYTTVDNRIDGAVLVFIDIESVKLDLTDKERITDPLVELNPQPLVVVDPELRVRTINESFTNKFGVQLREAVGSYVYSMANGKFHAPVLKDLLTRNSGSDTIEDVEVEATIAEKGKRNLLLNAKRVTFKDSGEGVIFISLQDISLFKAGKK